MRKKSFMFFVGVLVLLGIGFFTEAAAQPSDAQIKKDLTGAKTVSVSLGKRGAIEWSKTYKKYVWTRNFTAKVKTDASSARLNQSGWQPSQSFNGTRRTRFRSTSSPFLPKGQTTSADASESRERMKFGFTATT